MQLIKVEQKLKKTLYFSLMCLSVGAQLAAREQEGVLDLDGAAARAGDPPAPPATTVQQAEIRTAVPSVRRGRWSGARARARLTTRTEQAFKNQRKYLALRRRALSASVSRLRRPWRRPPK
jgi:hypothetical protein